MFRFESGLVRRFAAIDIVPRLRASVALLTLSALASAGYHSTSATPARLLTRRAATNSRSDRRLI